MSAAKKSVLQAAYPVWIGSLNDSVDEAQLTATFQHFGKIHSVTVQRDEFGRSKCFGYVNFTSISLAEKAAATMNSRTIAGQKVKTKGPKMLQKEGYLISGSKDYRPLTDCRYFMRKGRCKRKKNNLCPYRHIDIARYTTIVCKKWEERQCHNKDCVMLHPGGLGVKGSSSSTADEVQVDDDGDSDDFSSQSEDENESTQTFPSYPIGSGKLSDAEVARMMDLDVDDDTTGRSRLRQRDSSSSSSDSSDDSSSDEALAPIRSRQHKAGRRTVPVDEDMSSDDEPVKHSKVKKSNGGGKSGAASLEPVGIFWDIENCDVPIRRSAFHLAQKFRRHFVEGKREVEFMCVCDTLKETGEVINDLNKAHVTVVHVSAVAKNAADDKLRVSLRRFADTYDSPATVVMVTSDVNFSNDLHDLRHRHMFTVVLVHKQQASYALKACAHVTVSFEELVEDIPSREQDAAMRTTYSVTVRGFPPSMSRFKVKERLLFLTSNCGGSVNDVCDIKSGSARVRFRTQEAAIRAQRRLEGADMFGYPISAVFEQPQAHQPRPHPMSWKVNDHPLLPPQLTSSSSHHQMLQPHPFQPRPLPPLPSPHMPVNYNLSATFPPFSAHPIRPAHMSPPGSKAGQPILPGPHALPRGVPAEYYLPKPKPLMGVPPRPPNVFNAQPQMLMHAPQPVHRDQEIIIVAGKGRIVIDGIKAVKDKTLIPVPHNKLTGEIVKWCMMASVMIDQDLTIYWHTSMQYVVVVTVDLMKTSQVIQIGPSPSDVLHNQVMGRELLKRSCDALLGQFQMQQLPWSVHPCTWSQHQEEMIKTRSHIIGILKEQECGWLEWTVLSTYYNNIVKGAPIFPGQLEACCHGAVELQGTNLPITVAILTEMSPNVCVSAEPSIPRRFLRMIKKNLEGVRLLNLVGMYWKEFGPLPMDRAGKKLVDLLAFQKGIVFNGNMKDWYMVLVRVIDIGKLSGLDPISSTSSDVLLLQELYDEFQRLMLSTPNQRIPLDQFQPSYQTLYKRSFRVSDYGKEKMRDLLIGCPYLKLIGNMVHLQISSDNSLSLSAPIAPPSVVTVIQQPPPVLSSSEDDTDVTELHKSIKQILASTVDGKISLNDLKSRLKAERMLGNVDYIIQLLSECPFLKVEESKDGKVVCWSERWLAERKKSFAKECREVLTKEKDCEMTLQKFPEEFYRLYKRQLVCADYGYKKLVNMLESVPGLEVITTRNQTTLKFTENTASNLPSISAIKLQLEEFVWRCPDHTCTLVKLRPGFEASTKYKLDYTAYGYAKLSFMLEAMSDTIKFTGDGPNRLVSLQPLRKFACEVRQVMMSYPTGICFSNFAPAFRTCLGYECVVGHYGNFTKLSQVFEGISDTAKIVGEGAAKKVYLTHSKITRNEPLQVAPVSMPAELVNVAWNILVLLATNKDHMIPLGELAGQYNNAFSHQIKLSNYGCSNMETFLSSLPTIAVKEQDSRKIVTSPLPLLFVRDAIVIMIQSECHVMKWSEFLTNYEVCCGESFNAKAYGGSSLHQLLLNCAPWIEVDSSSTGVTLHLPAFVTTDKFIEAVNTSNVKLRRSVVDRDSAGMMSTGKDYRRLLSETKRLLLMSPTYSLTLLEIAEQFVMNGDLVCTSTVELHQILTTAQHNFMYNIADSTLSVETEARKKKLSKDFLYLYNKHDVRQLSTTELSDLYEECFNNPLDPHLYGCSSIVELIKCKYVNQILEVGSIDNVSVLTYTGKLHIVAARFAELLFTNAASWVFINCSDAYLRHFGTPLELNELQVSSIEELISKPNLKPIIVSEGGILRLRSTALLVELLRHLLSIHNGRIELDQLPLLFQKAFKHLPIIMEDNKIQEWIMGNNVLSVASQVVHLNNNKWVVWAPGAYPYPARTVGSRQTHTEAHLLMARPDDHFLLGTATTTTSPVASGHAHILDGNETISGSCSANSITLQAKLSPSHSKKVPSGGVKKKMAIKFPSMSVAKPKQDNPPPLIDMSTENWED